MGKSLNKVQLIANIGQPVEVKFTANSTAVVNLRVATNEREKNSTGEWVDVTEWHDVVVWNKLAEVIGQYANKGDRLYIEGRLKTRSYEAKDGSKRYVTEIIASDIILLGGKSQAQPQQAAQQQQQQQVPEVDEVPF